MEDWVDRPGVWEVNVVSAFITGGEAKVDSGTCFGVELGGALMWLKCYINGTAPNSEMRNVWFSASDKFIGCFGSCGLDCAIMNVSHMSDSVWPKAERSF